MALYVLPLCLQNLQRQQPVHTRWVELFTQTQWLARMLILWLVSLCYCQTYPFPGCNRSLLLYTTPSVVKVGGSDNSDTVLCWASWMVLLCVWTSNKMRPRQDHLYQTTWSSNYCSLHIYYFYCQTQPCSPVTVSTDGASSQTGIHNTSKFIIVKEYLS